MSFYENLRDNTAGPLIARFGQAALYRVHPAAVYDNATGKTEKGAPTDVSVKLLELSGFGPKQAQQWTEEVSKSMRAEVLVAADELATADVVPEVDEQLVYEGRVNRILARKRIGPSGVAVVYKMAVQYV